uniref:inactive histone-lysine N-methyltransferase 2E isoform X1 n=1 Tax=Vespula vulgaris TaxID=7454 RepID=UPI00223C2C74|nr:inactive histone-lysine N-methyltransferase 2E isoform X1 [Vespula vulgaris]XP_050869301.1 inactive histone-lysine N-methyltransferase 2E isoform X1 [Vespula vulgaris]XP_050869302.1 inactive histone-lysine N-methyltransferase 2E isoform X1 [Vespula vulgaris]XP_050869303.1 inactive histone-lysine N-methyltransferase 2E isoform X1 [Vespula vulgaris]
MEELETLESTECPECPGPPPEFRLPPPPRPPFLTEGTFCSEAPLAELEDCVAIPMIDASYHTNPSLQSTALIITCAVVLLLMAAIVSVVFWKHKRKVQNLLPCKSAAGAAAAAAAGRTRVLPDCQSHGGSGNTSAAVLYEDLPDTMTHSQLHNHLPSHHPIGQAPTIEVRGTNPREREHLRERQPQATLRAPAPHHLDYLDYRDPRAILRVTEKPSRAVLGGYRTPRALLAKSQEVSLSIATHAPRTISTLTNNTNVCQTQSNNNALLNSHLLLATQNALITSQQPLSANSTSPSSSPNMTNPNDENDRTIITTNNSSNNDSSCFPSARPRLPNKQQPITPTHRSKPQTNPPNSKNSSPTFYRTDPRTISPSEDQEYPIRRHSVDSEGYSYIDFKDTDLESLRSPPPPPPPPIATTSSKTTLRFPSSSSATSSNLLDSEGYAYILDSWYNRKAPGTARRIIVDGTEEEMCPLCTMQQIHQLLTRPEEIYLNVQDT